jgi:hypothetical protein
MESCGLRPIDAPAYVGRRPIVPYRVRDLLADAVSVHGWQAHHAKQFPRERHAWIVRSRDLPTAARI